MIIQFGMQYTFYADEKKKKHQLNAYVHTIGIQKNIV